VKDDPHKWAKGKSPRIYQGQGGEWKLTTNERKRILLNNIYGVDIDTQAVEVTKLSLLLKVLEGENKETIGRQLLLFQERALPDLANNIKCGNSLIGHDFYHGKQMTLFNEDEMFRINVFDWKAEFPEIMKDGEFDAVIGNPPYIRIQAMKEWAPREVEFYKTHYAAASKGNYDIYVVFVEKGLNLLNDRGRLGFILPHKFFNAKYGESLRKLLAAGKHLSRIIHFGDQQVFAGATNYTCLLFLTRASNKQFQYAKIDNLFAWRNNGKIIPSTLSASKVTAKEWNFVVGKGAGLFERMNKMPTKLVDVTDKIFQGLVTGADPVFILKSLGKGKYFSEDTQKKHYMEKELMHPLCKGSVNLRRYHIKELTKSILFPYKLVNCKAELLSVQELSKIYPLVWKYLKANQNKLEKREHGKWKNDRWYAFGRSQNLSEMEQKKILTPSIACFASFTLDSTDFYYFVGSGGGGGGGYGITLKQNEPMAYEYVLGLLNSKIINMYLKSFSTPFSGGYYAYSRQYIEKIPIRTIDFTNPTDKSQHDKMVTLVEQMLELYKQLATAKLPQKKTVLKRHIEATDRQINELVYELYGLTEKEIKIVETES
jgi:hypothetical protein